MQVFLVGGAVRDQLLNLPVKDRDWVIVGALPSQLIEQGYQQVGADFPVFLHPKTKEEYALARTERKSGTGYTGFQVEFNPDVTLEEDLLRRDLTINAMAQEEHTGNIIDPFNGQQDIADKQLRHVSEAFREDPLRVLRVARFAARFAHLGFEIAEETETLMAEMVETGELTTLVAERVWSEMSRALAEKTPDEFFRVLKRVGALKIIFPELNTLFGVPQTMRWHPEIDTGIHTLKALQCARKTTSDLDVLMATICHDLGKGLTPKELLPSHHQHEVKGAELIQSITQSYKWPTKVGQLCEQVARFHTLAHSAFSLKPKTIVSFLTSLGCFKQPDKLEKFLLACKADLRGRSGFEKSEYPQQDYLKQCLAVCTEVTAAPFVEQGLKGIEIGQAMEKERIRRVADIKKAISH